MVQITKPIGMILKGQRSPFELYYWTDITPTVRIQYESANEDVTGPKMFFLA